MVGLLASWERWWTEWKVLRAVVGENWTSGRAPKLGLLAWACRGVLACLLEGQQPSCTSASSLNRWSYCQPSTTTFVAANEYASINHNFVLALAELAYIQ